MDALAIRPVLTGARVRGLSVSSQRSACPRPAVSRRPERIVTKAAGASGGFFRDEKKEAARRALEAALGGKKDILADVERMRGGGDGGSGGGGGGGGWKPSWWGKDDGGAFKKESMTTAQAISAILGVLLLLTCWKPMLAILVNLVYYTFRIPRELPAAQTAAPGATAEEDVMKRLAQDDDE